MSNQLMMSCSFAVFTSFVRLSLGDIPIGWGIFRQASLTLRSPLQSLALRQSCIEVLVVLFLGHGNQDLSFPNKGNC